jgi:hypothetical protein
MTGGLEDWEPMRPSDSFPGRGPGMPVPYGAA